MKRYLSILLIEDEPLDCKNIREYTDTFEDIVLVGVTGHATKALDYIKDSIPDVIILDLELHKGSGNGLSFLMSLQKLNLPFVPFILITTNNTSSIIFEQARSFGADFIMVKTQVDYSAKTVIDFLYSMRQLLYSRGNKIEHIQTKNSSEQIHKRILKRIHSEIELVGISPKATGRKYLVDAIVLTIEGDSQNIYAALGQKHSKTDSSIERAMQNAINAAWRSSDIEDLQLYYTAHIRSQKGVPTIMEFVHYYADKIRNDYIDEINVIPENGTKNHLPLE